MISIKEALLYLHDDCNYDCSYCMVADPRFIKSESRAVTPEGTENIIRFFREHQNWHILLTGGEPTIHPQFIDLAEKLTENNYIRLDTNNSMSGEKLKAFIQRIDPERVDFIQCALHEKDESPERLQAYLQRVQQLKEAGFPTFVSYVAVPEKFTQIPDYYQLFTDAGIPFVLAPLRDHERNYPQNYSSAEIELLDRYMLSATQRALVEIDFRHSKGKACNAGYSRINIIGTNGMIRKCWRGAEALGNIYEQSMELYPTPRSCDVEQCSYMFETDLTVQELLYQDVEHFLSLPTTYDREIYQKYKEKALA